MLVFIRSQFSAILATLVDFLATVLVVEFLRLDPVVATMIGAVCGAMTSFILGRRWVFKAQDGEMASQLMRYSIVWLGSVALNILGMYLLTDVIGVSYIYSKVITSIVVGIGYNFFLQRDVVFPSS